MRRACGVFVCVLVGAFAWGSACAIYDQSLLLPARSGDGGGDEVTSTDDGAADVLTDVPTEDGCAPGFARCGGSACSVQLQVDPKNCGACGHDCLGAACLNALCQPLVVAAQQSAPAYVAVDNGVVYWTNSGSGTVMRANIDGTGRQQISSGNPTCWMIRVRNGRVYFANDTTGGNVVSVNTDGTGKIDLSGPQPSPRGLGVDDTYVFFDTEDTDAGTVQRTLLDGTGRTLLAQRQGSPKDLVTDGAYVYWTNRDDGNIMRMPVAGGAATPIITDDAPFGLAIAGNYLYWTNRLAAGSIARALLDGSGKITLSRNENLPREIAVDSSYAYYTNEGEGTVKRVPLTGGAVTTLAAGFAQPWGIAVDAKFVYWAARGGGLVLRVAK